MIKYTEENFNKAYQSLWSIFYSCICNEKSETQELIKSIFGQKKKYMNFISNTKISNASNITKI